MPLHFRSFISFIPDVNPAPFFLRPRSFSSVFLPLRLFLRLTRLNPRHGQIGSTDVTSSFVLAFLFLPPFAFPTRSSRFATLGGDVQNLLTETLFGECAFSFEFRHSDVNSHVLNVSEFSIRPVVDAARLKRARSQICYIFRFVLQF